MRIVDDAAQFARVSHDVDAFEAVYRRYVGRVTAYAASRCSCAADVADVVAQTFVRVLGAGGQYDPSRGEPIAYLIAIARSVVGDHYRGVDRERRLVHRLSGRDLLEADESERIDAAIDATRAAGPARGALAGVPSAESEVLELVAEGASPTEAAAALGITPGTARVRLHRGRGRIRSKLANQIQEK